MMVREPVVAGRFYPATRKECLQQIEALAPQAPFAERIGQQIRFLLGMHSHGGG